MKKIVFALFIAGTGINLQAQPQTSVINLSTGVYNVPPPNQPALMPCGIDDSNWKLLRQNPVSGDWSAIPDYTSTGREYYYMNCWCPSYNSSNWQTSFQSINPDVRMIAPNVLPNDLYNSSNNMIIDYKGDLLPTTPGNYLFARDFDFGKTCNSSIQSAYLDLRLLTGDGIVSVEINGKMLTLPNYPSLPSSPNFPHTNYLEVFNAHAAGNNFNDQPPYSPNMPNGPFSTYIPAVQINIPTWYFESSGPNRLIVRVNTNASSASMHHIAALMMDADIVVNWTAGPQLMSVSPTGPQNLITGQPITISATGFFPGYNLQILPGTTAGATPVSLSATYTPVVNTRYMVRLTNNANGCVDRVRIPVTVSTSLFQRLDLNQSSEMIDQGKTGIIMPHIDDINSNDYWVKVVDMHTLTTIYNGYPNVATEVSPSVTTEYYVSCILPDGSETVDFWTIEVLSNGGGERIASQPATQNAANYFTVSPNPSDALFNITLPKPENGSISVFDLTGKEIWQGQLNATSNQYVIDMTAFAPGVYVIVINSESGKYSQKLIRE
ncbi:MAG: T9SS type A sorting domain-containing protein [Bacteroidia bacterium]|nr:T9SS type A sorting domain-containing protein [Bacteroidia bacterium]